MNATLVADKEQDVPDLVQTAWKTEGRITEIGGMKGDLAGVKVILHALVDHFGLTIPLSEVAAAES